MPTAKQHGIASCNLNKQQQQQTTQYHGAEPGRFELTNPWHD